MSSGKREYKDISSDTQDSSTKSKEKSKVKKNTAVFVTGLPADTTFIEIYDYFSKYGIIMNDMFTGQPRIKLYYNDNGVREGEDEDGNSSFKGEALVVYLREESANMAVDLLDESHFRYNSPPIRVQHAQFDEEHQQNTGSNEGGKVEKKVWKEHMQAMKRKLEWSLNDDISPEEEEAIKAEMKKRQKYNRIVILRGMFGREEWEEAEVADAADSVVSRRSKIVTELKTDLQEEAIKLGTVTSIHILGREGICSVKFRESEAALACVKLMDGRRYGGRRISAALYDGSFSLREEKEWERKGEEERIEKFGEWLEQEQEQAISEYIPLTI